MGVQGLLVALKEQTEPVEVRALTSTGEWNANQFVVQVPAPGEDGEGASSSSSERYSSSASSSSPSKCAVGSARSPTRKPKRNPLAAPSPSRSPYPKRFCADPEAGSSEYSFSTFSTAQRLCLEGETGATRKVPRAAVDASAWLHRGVYACAWELAHAAVAGCAGNDENGENGDDSEKRAAAIKPAHKYVGYCMRRVRQLRHMGLEPVLVFDGADLPAKAGTETERRLVAIDSANEWRGLWDSALLT